MEEYPDNLPLGEADIEDSIEVEFEGTSAEKEVIHDNSISLYLKQMGAFSLLTKEEEIDVAGRIYEGRRKIQRLVFNMPFAIKKIIAFKDMLRMGRITMADLVSEWEDMTEPDRADMYREFLKKIKTIKTLYDDRVLLLKRLNRRNLKGTTKRDLLDRLNKNRDETFEAVSGLRLREDVIGAFIEQLRMTTSEMDNLYKRTLSLL